MTNLNKTNLNNIISGTATKWKEQLEYHHKNKNKIRRAQLFALDLMDYMDAHKIKQKDLALKMNVSPQQVNKILRAKANLTFETLDKIADALGVVISAPKIEVKRQIYSKVLHNKLQIVHKKGMAKIEEDITTKRVVMKNPLLENNLQAMNAYSFTSVKM